MADVVGVLRILAILVGCLLLAFVSLPPDEPAAAPSASASETDFVHVEHRLVTVEATPVPPVRTVRQAAQKLPPVTRRHTPPRTFLAQAKQLVLGDGRARPEPFPRIHAK